MLIFLALLIGARYAQWQQIMYVNDEHDLDPVPSRLT